MFALGGWVGLVVLPACRRPPRRAGRRGCCPCGGLVKNERGASVRVGGLMPIGRINRDGYIGIYGLHTAITALLLLTLGWRFGSKETGPHRLWSPAPTPRPPLGSGRLYGCVLVWWCVCFGGGGWNPPKKDHTPTRPYVHTHTVDTPTYPRTNQ